MMRMCYIGLDIHKKIIFFCIKTANGDLVGSGTIPATRRALSEWIAGLPQRWIVAMEATLFSVGFMIFSNLMAMQSKLPFLKC